MLEPCLLQPCFHVAGAPCRVRWASIISIVEICILKVVYVYPVQDYNTMKHRNKLLMGPCWAAKGTNTTVDFRNFIVFLLGRDPGTLKSDIVSKRHPQLICSDLRLSNWNFEDWNYGNRPCAGIFWSQVRPVHLLRVSLLRVAESNFPGDSLYNSTDMRISTP